MTDEIQHHGVLGMKWGVRKDRKPQGHGNSPSGSRKQSKLKRAASNVRAANKEWKSSQKTRKPSVIARDALIASGIAVILGHTVNRITEQATYTKGARLTKKLMEQMADTRVDVSGFQQVMVNGQEIFKKVSLN